MVRTINSDDIRHLNLFNKITRVSTRFCLKYNGALIFCVPRRELSKAIGENGKNIYEMKKILGKKIRVIPQPRSIEDVRHFIENIVKPTTFKDLEINENEIIIEAGGMQNKAMLLGRNKQRLLDLQRIIRSFFGKELKII